MSHPLVTTLKNLRGNVRGCVYTEPLWGIPYALFTPFASVYMRALGLSDSQIGTVASVGLSFQVLWTLLSGAITDKVGRKRTTLIFDLLSWSLACLVWAAAQNIVYFLVAAILNGLVRISGGAWQCLLVEDTEPEILVDVYAWVYISALVANFASPLTGLAISRFSLVPTMRALYFFGFLMMTAKFLIMNRMVTETRQGLLRLRETAQQPLSHILGEYRSVLGQFLLAPRTRFATGLVLALSIGTMISGAFWSILVTERLLFPAERLALFTFARSLVVLFFYFALLPRFRRLDVRTPMAVGFLGLIGAQLLLISAPPQNYLWLLAAILLEGLSIPTATTLLDKLVVVSVSAQERARMMAILYVIVLLCTSPFGWIAGQLSALNRSWPFMLNIALYAIGGLMVYRASRLVSERIAVGE